MSARSHHRTRTAQPVIAAAQFRTSEIAKDSGGELRNDARWKIATAATTAAVTSTAAITRLGSPHLKGRNLIAPVDRAKVRCVAFDPQPLTTIFRISIELDARPAEDTNRADAIVPAGAAQIALVVGGVPALRAATVVDVLVDADAISRRTVVAVVLTIVAADAAEEPAAAPAGAQHLERVDAIVPVTAAFHGPQSQIGDVHVELVRHAHELLIVVDDDPGTSGDADRRDLVAAVAKIPELVAGAIAPRGPLVFDVAEEAHAIGVAVIAIVVPVAPLLRERGHGGDRQSQDHQSGSSAMLHGVSNLWKGLKPSVCQPLLHAGARACAIQRPIWRTSQAAPRPGSGRA